MKSKRRKFNFVTLFGIIFILGGILAASSAFLDFRKANSAPYKMQVESDVISLESKSNWIDNSEIKSIQSGSVDWFTEEEIHIGDKVMTFEGVYPDPSSGHVTHTLISNDGINWEVNDIDTRDLLIQIAAGAIFLVAGAVITFFSFKI